MQFLITFLAATPLAYAFPAALLEQAAKDPQIAARALELAKVFDKRQQGADAASAIFEPIPVFNAADQYIDVSPGSGHEYVAPGPGDLRGPCPGLNAFANHGFLPHNGYATITQYLTATQKVVGMGPLLSTFLTALGAALDGDLLSWSIAGTPSVSQGGLTGSLGHGLVGSHNKYECDASPTRPDLYEAGNNYITQSHQFQEMVDHSPGGQITLDSLTAFRSYRFDKQINSNPRFFNGPFTGLLVQPAAYTFIYRFMANHSEADPLGVLSYETAQSWFGIEGSYGHYKAVPGTERIPDNWYRRAQAYPYESVYFLADLLAAAKLHPKFLSIGGNTHGVGTFTGVDMARLTGGVFNAATLLQGNNLVCFLYQLSTQAKPDVLLGLLSPLTNAVGAIIGPLGCPNLRGIDDRQLRAFPGYSSSPVYG